MFICRHELLYIYGLTVKLKKEQINGGIVRHKAAYVTDWLL